MGSPVAMDAPPSSGSIMAGVGDDPGVKVGGSAGKKRTIQYLPGIG